MPRSWWRRQNHLPLKSVLRGSLRVRDDSVGCARLVATLGGKELVGRVCGARTSVLLQRKQPFAGVAQGKHGNKIRHLGVVAKPVILGVVHLLCHRNHVPGLLRQLFDLFARKPPLTFRRFQGGGHWPFPSTKKIPFPGWGARREKGPPWAPPSVA